MMELPYPSPKSWGEVRENLEFLRDRLSQLARESIDKSVEWAKENGIDKVIIDIFHELNRIERELDRVTEGSCNPVKFRCLLALNSLRKRL